MTITPAQLVSHGSPAQDIVVVPDGTNAFVLVVKTPSGSRPREIEQFTILDAVNSTAGPHFFNINPRRVERLDQSFGNVTGLSPSAGTLRLYWTDGLPSAGSPIRAMDYDLVLNESGTVQTEDFEGIDPFVMDARDVNNPGRIYLLYARADGANVGRRSPNLGGNWGAEEEIDPSEANVARSEAVFDKPVVNLEDLKILQQRL